MDQGLAKNEHVDYVGWQFPFHGLLGKICDIYWEGVKMWIIYIYIYIMLLYNNYFLDKFIPHFESDTQIQ